LSIAAPISITSTRNGAGGIAMISIGPTKIRAYDGTLVQEDIHKAYISFKIGKQKHTQKVYALDKRGSDRMILATALQSDHQLGR